MSILTPIGIALAERGWTPDIVMSTVIRLSCRNRLLQIRRAFQNDPEGALATFLTRLEQSAIAEATSEANEQHYELPEEFFGYTLGARRKYSGCEWEESISTLDGAEETALATIMKRARLEKAESILELGCGWGSLSLYMAERLPNASITAVSNSAGQQAYIQAEAQRRGLINLTVLRADINTFQPTTRFDRIVTVEMLEHVRNYRALFARMTEWLKDDGFLFVHIFRHLQYPYTFETEGAANWMGRLFFTGGVMPSHDLLVVAQDSLSLEEQWFVEGTNYAKTANAWLGNLDRNRAAVLHILAQHYGKQEATRWLNRWRIFFMACRELFGYAGGKEWGVSHYLFRHPVAQREPILTSMRGANEA